MKKPAVMRKEAVKKMKSKKMISFPARKRLVKKLVKQALSRVLSRKLRIAGADHKGLPEYADGILVPGSCGVIVNGEFVRMTSGFLVNSAACRYYLPVIDNRGFFIGEFSRLDDDLRFSHEEDENPYSDMSTWF